MNEEQINLLKHIKKLIKRISSMRQQVNTVRAILIARAIFGS